MAEINKILFITLSNIGDVILTLPVLDYLKNTYPESKITVMSGPRPAEIFAKNPSIERFIIYDKHVKLKEKIKLFKEFKREKFNLIIDLRNSFYGALLPAKLKTNPFLAIPAHIRHMRDRHLYKVTRTPGHQDTSPGASLNITTQDEEYIDKILRDNKIAESDNLIVIAPGARSHIKRWAKEKFTELIPALIKEFQAKVILVGDKEDAYISGFIAQNSMDTVLDLAAKTTLAQLAYLLEKVKLVISCDSAVLHLASYLNRPIVAIFGPTDESKYGPWARDSIAVKKEIFCRPCQKAQCRFGTLECMHSVKVEDVLRQVKRLSAVSRQPSAASPKQDFKRILVVRTDRIGDVLLSTPVIKTLRDTYPNAFIAMMISPYAKEIIEGNPDLDAVIIYDKDGKHKSWYRTLKFALNLKKKRFDLAIILHPTNRVHLVTFFAAIAKRLGYARKLGILLTDRLKHTKQLGEKHELEYNFDLLNYLGISPSDKTLFMPIKIEAEKWAEDLFKQQKIDKSDKLLAIHPGASCPSKIWPAERFAEVADALADKYGFKVLIIAGPKDITLAKNVAKHMRHQVLDLGGKTSIAQLASVLKKCTLFISNDSGPVHMASALGVPVISIFGRNQKGLSPKRWGPVGKKDKLIHKEIGCDECLAHDCKKEFACLKAIKTAEVVAAVDSILASQ